MKCIITGCKYTGETLSPDGICGFCKLQNVLADYENNQKAKEFVKNMGQGALEESKMEHIESIGLRE